jgi:hypothetical protein
VKGHLAALGWCLQTINLQLTDCDFIAAKGYIVQVSDTTMTSKEKMFAT